MGKILSRGFFEMTGTQSLHFLETGDILNPFCYVYTQHPWEAYNHKHCVSHLFVRAHCHSISSVETCNTSQHTQASWAITCLRDCHGRVIHWPGYDMIPPLLSSWPAAPTRWCHDCSHPTSFYSHLKVNYLWALMTLSRIHNNDSVAI